MRYSTFRALFAALLVSFVLVTAPAVAEGDYSFYAPPESAVPYANAPGTEVANVIFLIGDGMGLSHTSLARVTASGLAGALHLERLPVVGLIRTHSADGAVTDSAAAGTAMACGIKTDNGVIGLDPDGRAYVSVLQAAAGRGMATGLVATSSITHATPASFAAHVESRDNETTIAEHLLGSRVNVLLGGGRQYFQGERKKGVRKDGRNLVREARKDGYKYVDTAKALQAAEGPYVLGLFQKEALTTEEPEPAVAELTRKSIEILSKDEDGFFLMVEGSQIDWAAHGGKTDDMVKQTLQFDEAVKVAMDFAVADGRTLVVVTADHETGALTLHGGKADDSLKAHWSSGSHSGTPVPVYAYGPRSAFFSGVWDNTDIAKKMAALLGLGPFPRLREGTVVTAGQSAE